GERPMKVNYLAWPLGLLLASTTMAAPNPNEAFLEAVQQEFVRNTIAGTWKTDCVIRSDSGSSFIAVYEFSDKAAATLIRYDYLDSDCVIPAEVHATEGTASLQGLAIDQHGNYVYDLLVTSETGDRQEISFHLDLGDTLSV